MNQGNGSQSGDNSSEHYAVDERVLMDWIDQIGRTEDGVSGEFSPERLLDYALMVILNAALHAVKWRAAAASLLHPFPSRHDGRAFFALVQDVKSGEHPHYCPHTISAAARAVLERALANTFEEKAVDVAVEAIYADIAGRLRSEDTSEDSIQVTITPITSAADARAVIQKHFGPYDAPSLVMEPLPRN